MRPGPHGRTTARVSFVAVRSDVTTQAPAGGVDGPIGPPVGPAVPPPWGARVAGPLQGPGQPLLRLPRARELVRVCRSRQWGRGGRCRLWAGQHRGRPDAVRGLPHGLHAPGVLLCTHRLRAAVATWVHSHRESQTAGTQQVLHRGWAAAAAPAKGARLQEGRVGPLGRVRAPSRPPRGSVRGGGPSWPDHLRASRATTWASIPAGTRLQPRRPLAQADV